MAASFTRGRFVAHAAAVIDDQSHADGDVFALEDGKFLLDFVLVDAKVLRLEAVSEALAVVDDGRVQNDQVDVDDQLRALLASVGILAGRMAVAGNWEREPGRRRQKQRKQQRKL